MVKIVDTGKKLPKARIADLFELWENRKKLVVKPVHDLSRNHGDVIYGRHAVNHLTGVTRGTYDFDVYSSHSKKHAIRIEQSIDTGTDSNLAYVEPMTYVKDGKTKRVWRVRTRPHGQVECDYQVKPRGLRYKSINGVRYETLDRAEKKYGKMIRQGDMHRFPNAFFDYGDVKDHRNIKKGLRLWKK